MKNLYLIFIVLLFSISFTSAYFGVGIDKSFIKEPAMEYGKVIITDQNMFSPDKVKEEITLVKNTQYCSNDCSAEKEIILYEDGALIDSVRFETLNGFGTIKSYKFMIRKSHEPREVNDYSWVCKETGKMITNISGSSPERYCSNELTGTHTEYTDTWEEYKEGTIMPKGSYYLKLEGDLSGGLYEIKTIDWLITTNGKEISEWATWTSGLDVGLISYYKFDDATIGNDSLGLYNLTGTNTPTTTIGKINQATRLESASSQYWTSGFSQQGNKSISFAGWFNITDLSANRYVFIIGTSGGGKAIGVYQSSGDSKLYLTDLSVDTEISSPTIVNWYHVAVVYENVSGVLKTYINGVNTANRTKQINLDTTVLTIGSNSAHTERFTGVLDEWGVWNRSLSSAEITQLYNGGAGITYNLYSPPSVTLNSPTNNYQTINTLIPFNYTADISYQASFVNASLWTNSSGSWRIENTSTTLGQIIYYSFPYGAYNWSVAICDSLGCSQGTNRTFTISKAIVNSATYNPTTSSFQNESYILNMSYASGYTIGAYLNYGGNNYLSSSSLYGDSVIFTNYLTTPQSSSVKTFFWNYSLTNSSGTTYYSTSWYNQTINPIVMKFCNATAGYNVPFINFTSKSSTSPYGLINISFKSSWQYGGSDLIYYNNYSYSDTAQTNSSFAFCFNPASNNYTTNAKIEYTATGYAQNYYYLTNAVLNNITNNITLYILNDSLATLTEFLVQNDMQNPMSDVYIQVQLYDVALDQYYTVAMLKTGYDGKDIAYLNWYDSFYKFILIQNDQVIYVTSPTKISAAQTFNIPTGVDYHYDRFRDMSYSLTFNNASGNFILTFVKPSSLVDTGCLRVIKRTTINETQVCDTCSSSASATIYCNVNAYGNGTFIGTFYATGSPSYVYEDIIAIIGAINTIYNLLDPKDAAVYGFITAGVVMTMFLLSPVLAVLGSLIGISIALAMGFLPIASGGFWVGFGGPVIVGLIIIWLLRR